VDIQRSSLQRRIFSQLPGLNRIVNCFVTTGSVEKRKSSGRPKVMKDVVENIGDHLEPHPRTYLTRLSLQTAVHVIKLLEHLHPYKITTDVQ
jgi:hypothetical protein